MARTRVYLASLALVALGAVTLSSAALRDDPPPEPVDCPLCGGNPELHVRRMFGIERMQGRVLSYALRW